MSVYIYICIHYVKLVCITGQFLITSLRACTYIHTYMYICIYYVKLVCITGQFLITSLRACRSAPWTTTTSWTDYFDTQKPKRSN